MRDTPRPGHLVDIGVWVFGGGPENPKESIVAIDGTVTDGPPARQMARGDARNH